MEPKLINLTDAEILCAMWISRKFANEKNRSFASFLGQILDIMVHDKEEKGEIKNKPEYYVKKINYSWIRPHDKISEENLSSIEMLIVVKLAMIESKKSSRNFTYIYDIALQMVLNEKANYESKSPDRVM
jgi:hypothetical protein